MKQENGDELNDTKSEILMCTLSVHSQLLRFQHEVFRVTNEKYWCSNICRICYLDCFFLFMAAFQEMVMDMPKYSQLFEREPTTVSKAQDLFNEQPHLLQVIPLV